MPRAEGHNTGGGVEPFQSEGRSSTVTEQPFDACSVVTLDVNGGVDAEPAGSLPGKHAVGVNLVEQVVAMEVAQHTTLHDVLQLVPVLRHESGGLMEAHLPVRRVGEHAIEHNHVEVEVRVQRCAEPMLVRMSECRIPLVLTTDRYTAWWIQHRLRRTRKEFAADRLEKKGT